jgi:hypothetical protein
MKTELLGATIRGYVVKFINDGIADGSLKPLVALKSGIQAPLLQVERGLSTAFWQVIGRFSHVS